MATPPPSSSRLRGMLQSAVQSVQWTYSLFWQICPQQGMLIWADGYYNGAIKTRKTVQPMEVSSEEASLQRSQQLRELYDTLSAGETNQPARRPCAALSPEDLTESEWFYLMCVSFSFPPGVGLPGKAYSRRQHVWLTGANEVDSKTFSRAILAKSARVQTVVCIPLLDGVVELGTTDRVPEDLAFVQHVKTFFVDHHHLPPPKPALSEHSTSNPATSSDHHPRFHSPHLTAIRNNAAANNPPPLHAAAQEDDEDEDEEEDDEGESDSEAETGRNGNGRPLPPAGTNVPAAEPSELMQLEMSEDIRLGSPDDASNNLDSDFHMLAVSQSANAADQQRQADSYRAESARRWPPVQPPMSAVQPPPSGPLALEELNHDDTHYSETVSTILQTQATRWTDSSSNDYVTYSSQSAFAKWTSRADHHLLLPVEGASQWLLKYILFSVPFLHTKYRDENSPKSSHDGEGSTRLRKGTSQDELSANHVLAERRRREKLNERFIILRSLVPFVTKMDKASILGDTIEYVKQLRKKIQDLEARNVHLEDDQQRTRSLGEIQRSSSMKELRSGLTVTERSRVGPPGSDKRKLRIVEGSGGVAVAKPKAVEEPTPPPPPPAPELTPPTPMLTGTSLEVSIIESDGLLELQCPYREGLLLDVMQTLRDLRIETTVVQSSLNSGNFVAELRAKVGKKTTITQVKRAVNQVIPQSDS
ncbi:PREDICTED: basic helix-loop-helix protein A isoform X1 [Fragaria vesca subsp. vesca]|uniref:basic helix-loop-helix protein A isoform X1 n=2 Tax=Fragaria vesca subsp. vesca TaxID=101020 RepID=UPI0002C36F63|nr:PREDICTED: basic helix-loop-helix protein A isoform X1 [Fragaria vesca subsp. vesca]